jgi:uncharacterized protein
MPGISVTTGVRVGPTGADTAPASTLFIAGTAERGPTDRARLILGVNQFDTVYGGYTSATTLRDSVKTFFEEGGSRCYVIRALGSGSARASVTVTDGGGTPATVLTLTAATPGVWANSTASAPVKDGLKAITTVSGTTFSINITYQGVTVFSGGPYRDEVLADGTIKYAKQFAAEEINASAFAANFVTAAVGPSTSLPAASTRLFASGVDGTAVTATDVVTALGLFDYDLGAGAVAAPGWTTTAMWDGLREHAAANRRIALCGFQVGTSAAAATSAASAYWGTDTASKTKASHMAFYWPSVKVPDGFGGTRDQTPEAYVAAARARAHRQTGAWRAGAGEASTARYILGLYEDVSRTTADSLDANRINALRVIQGNVRVYGARSISADDTNWRFITYRDALNYITAQAEIALEPLVFSPIDGRGNLFGRVEAVLTGIMDPIRAIGGVYPGIDPNTGNQVDGGYSVACSPVNNPTGLLAQGQVSATIGARVSPVADQISVTITKSALNAAV